MIFALVAFAIGVARPSAVLAVVPPNAARVEAAERTVALLTAVDAGAPLPFLGSQDGATSGSFEIARITRGPRVGERSDAALASGASSSTMSRAATRARATRMAFLEYAHVLFQRRAGIPSYHTIAPPPLHI